MSLSAAQAHVRSCGACSLRAGCRSPVPVWAPTITPRVAVIGEAPGEEEDRRGIPFCGRAGEYLDRVWRQIPLPGAPALLNTVCCRPPNNRTPQSHEIAACAANLDLQLDVVGAEVVVLVGQVALNRFRAGGIADWRGVPWRRGGRVWVATYHPAYVLRQPAAEKLFREDLGKVRGLLAGWWPGVCACGEPAVSWDGEGIPQCRAGGGCMGRVCCFDRKPAEWRVEVDGVVRPMCRGHKVKFEFMKGVRVVGVA